MDLRDHVSHHEAFCRGRPAAVDPTRRWLIISGIAASYLLIALGYRLDGALTAETMTRGDALVRQIEDYRRATGTYPQRLDEIGARPVPALDGSAFTYGRDEVGGYVIAFPSVAFLTCTRSSTVPEWVCDD